MTNQIIFEFVNIFFPEHKPFWENLKEEEKAFLNSIPYNEDKLKKVIFNPEENSAEVEKFRNKMKDLEMIISHRECVFDFFLFKVWYSLEIGSIMSAHLKNCSALTFPIYRVF